MLSLPFILALVGAGVGLLVGILIFGQISEAIECPASEIIGGGGEGSESESVFVTMSYDNLGTIGGVNGDARYYENIDGDGGLGDGGHITEFISATPLIGNGAVYQKGLGTDAVEAELILSGNQLLSDKTWQFLFDYGTDSDTVSINFWVNGDVQGSPVYPLINTYNGESGVGSGIFLYTRGGATYLAINEWDSSLVNIVQTNFNLPGDNEPPDDNQWHMVTLTYDKSQTTDFARLCIDGSTNCDTISTSNPFAAGLSPQDTRGLFIGSNHVESMGESLTENGFDVDDVTIWNGYILDDTDIDNLYSGGSGSSAGASGEDISSATRVAHWSFDSPTANQVEHFTGGTFFNTFGLGGGSYIDLGDNFEEGNLGQLVTLSDQAVVSVSFPKLPESWNRVSDGQLTAKVWSGVTEGSPSSVEVATSDVINLDPNTTLFNGTFYFTTKPVLTGDYVVGVHWFAEDDDSILYTILSDVGGNEGFFLVQETDGDDSNWETDTILDWSSSEVADLEMKVKFSGGGGGGGSPAQVGAEQCEQAKDTAWTVIGIMPVALFFGLFALFSSFGKPT